MLSKEQLAKARQIIEDIEFQQHNKHMVWLKTPPQKSKIYPYK